MFVLFKTWQAIVYELFVIARDSDFTLGAERFFG